MFTLFTFKPSYYCGPMAFNRQLPVDDPSINRAYVDAVAGYFSLDTSNWNSVRQNLHSFGESFYNFLFYFSQLLVVFLIIFWVIAKAQAKGYKELSVKYMNELEEIKDQRKELFKDLAEKEKNTKVFKEKYEAERRLRKNSMAQESDLV